MQIWRYNTRAQVDHRIRAALSANINFLDESILGLPVSAISETVAPNHGESAASTYLSLLMSNPNHIGCHTLGQSESFFGGTQALERELIQICAVDILNGEAAQQDGYVAAGGTEGNMQAVWIYRNFFLKQRRAKRDEICLLFSADSHYSLDKSADILALDVFKVPVHPANRRICVQTLRSTVDRARRSGKKYFIVVANMMTTMFGSVDDATVYADELARVGCEFKMHVDAAFGGFYYPFLEPDTPLSFNNPHVTSLVMDAHKFARAPYGTGIFVIRKGYMQYAHTQQASYIQGADSTISGSRSGANALAAWMILASRGPQRWTEDILEIQRRTDWLCKHLTDMGIEFYRHPKSNIVTIRREHVDTRMVKEFCLVPDDHQNPAWYKIVVMEHVTYEKLGELLTAFRAAQRPRRGGRPYSASTIFPCRRQAGIPDPAAPSPEFVQ